MITKINGHLDEILENSLVVKMSGMFFEILMTPYSLEKVRGAYNIGDELTLITKFYIEAGVAGGNFVPRLIGFQDKMDADFFKIYTTVKGLGDKKALKSLVLSSADTAQAIEISDLKVLKSFPGIGGRMAEKIVAELRGKLGLFASAVAMGNLFSKPTQKTGLEESALEILVGQLGYRRVEAENLVEKALEAHKKFNSVEELIQTIFSMK